MPLINGCKYSCAPCIRGHRSTSCNHTDRILIEVRKPGRPLESCGHNWSSCQCGKVDSVFGIGVEDNDVGIVFEREVQVERNFTPVSSISVDEKEEKEKEKERDKEISSRTPKAKTRIRGTSGVGKKSSKKRDVTNLERLKRDLSEGKGKESILAQPETKDLEMGSEIVPEPRKEGVDINLVPRDLEMPGDVFEETQDASPLPTRYHYAAGPQIQEESGLVG